VFLGRSVWYWPRAESQQILVSIVLSTKKTLLSAFTTAKSFYYKLLSCLGKENALNKGE
jgi:hypothetical protein